MTNESPLTAYRAWRVCEGRTTDVVYHMDKDRAKEEIARQANIGDSEWVPKNQWSDDEIVEGRRSEAVIYVKRIRVKR